MPHPGLLGIPNPPETPKSAQNGTLQPVLESKSQICQKPPKWPFLGWYPISCHTSKCDIPPDTLPTRGCHMPPRHTRKPCKIPCVLDMYRIYPLYPLYGPTPVHTLIYGVLPYVQAPNIGPPPYTPCQDPICTPPKVDCQSRSTRYVPPQNDTFLGVPHTTHPGI